MALTACHHIIFFFLLLNVEYAKNTAARNENASPKIIVLDIFPLFKIQFHLNMWNSVFQKFS